MVYLVSTSALNGLLVIGTNSGQVILLDGSTLHYLFKCEPHAAEITGLAFIYSTSEQQLQQGVTTIAATSTPLLLIASFDGRVETAAIPVKLFSSSSS